MVFNSASTASVGFVEREDWISEFSQFKSGELWMNVTKGMNEWTMSFLIYKRSERLYEYYYPLYNGATISALCKNSDVANLKFCNDGTNYSTTQNITACNSNLCSAIILHFLQIMHCNLATILSKLVSVSSLFLLLKSCKVHWINILYAETSVKGSLNQD